MKILELTPTARARVWFGGGVGAFSALGSMKAAVEGRPNLLVPMSHVTLEAFVPRGARAEYGLLGLRFDSAGHTELKVEVPYSDDVGNSWSEALGAGVDDIRLGLPREFAQPILDTVVAYVTHRFPPGEIRVVKAAHGLVGSSSNFFKGLATCALELIEDEQQRSDRETARLLRKRLVERQA